MSFKGIAKQTLEFLDEGGYVHPSGARVELVAPLEAVGEVPEAGKNPLAVPK